MQYVKFPMSTLRITQGYGLEVDGVSTAASGGTYSHTGSYALDLGGVDTGADYLYAPCDVVVKRHYVGSGYNAVWYQTVEPVMCADGQSRELVFMLLHANDSAITELGITVGKTFAQGEKFYKEGTGGGVGTHCHLEVGLAPFTGTGWAKSSYVSDLGENVWIINNKLIPSNIFYLSNDTNVVEDMGYNWRYLSENYIEYTTPMGVRVSEGTGKNVEYFNTADVNDVAGGHLPEGSEYVALGYTTAADDNGFTYVKFIYTDGNEYWMAILNDRIELFERDIGVSDILDKTFFIQANGTNFYLNVYGIDTVANERNVNVYSLENCKAQRWTLKQTSGGIKLFTTIDEAYALNIYRIDNNCTMYIAEGNDADSVLIFESVGDMLYKIKSSTHNKYLAVDGTAANGTNVVWADTATMWKLIPENDLFPEREIFEEGIDVSDHQGVIDWTKVAQTGQKFAIIKAVGTNTNGIYISTYWEDNYKGAKDNGIKVGAFLYTYAFNETEAEEELSYLLQALRGKQFEYPIFVDVEDKLLYQNCTKEEITNTVKYLCARLKEEGYYPAVYTYTNYANTYLNMDDLSEYDTWIADYTGSVGYTGDYTIWQYTSTGSVDGISGNVDMDISYKDYETLIKNMEVNGFMATEKTFNTRLKLKYDTHENWVANDPVLLQGEVAVTTISVAQEGAVNTVPAVLMKVGDGTHKYSELGFVNAKAADVYDWAKAKTKPVYAATEITGIDAKIADYVSNEMGIEVDTDTQYKIVKVTDYQYKLMSKSKGDVDYTTEVSVIDIPNDTAAITALQGLVGDTKVADQIAKAISDLKLAETYAAKVHTHAIADVTGLQAALDGKEAAGAAAQALVDAKAYTDEKIGDVDLSGIATNAAAIEGLATRMGTAEGEIDALQAAIGEGGSVTNAIAAAKKAGDDAQADVNALAGKVGTVADGKTVVGMIAEAQAAATYDDTALVGRVSNLETLVGDTSVADQIAVETSRAEGVESGLNTRLAAVEADYLKAADKTALQTQITTNANAIERLTNGVSAEEVDGVNDLIQYVKDHGAEVTGIKADIKANSNAIDVIEADYLKAADKTELQGNIDTVSGNVTTLEGVVATKAAQTDLDTLAGRVTAVEGDLNTETTGLKARMTAAEADIDALQAKMGDGTVSDQIDAALKVDGVEKYALATGLTAAEGRIATLEGKSHEHANKAELDKFADGDKAKLDAAVQTVTAGTGLTATKTGADVAIGFDDSVTFIFDCGSSSVNV